MYDQHLDETVSRRPSTKELSSPIIAIKPYTLVLAAERVQEGSEAPSFVFTSRHAITGEISTQTYDAIVCATGYQRTAWIDLLKTCEIGKYFGLDKTTDASQTQLAPETDLHGLVSRMSGPLSDGKASASESAISTPISSSASNTPPTSPSLTDLSLPAPTIYVSRKYQLLPNRTATGEPEFKPRIYVQGVEEATHGLSDTLLSVMGVRAGEVVGDICRTN
jgi:L-ornithine N5-monooxygenase